MQSIYYEKFTNYTDLMHVNPCTNDYKGMITSYKFVRITVLQSNETVMERTVYSMKN